MKKLLIGGVLLALLLPLHAMAADSAFDGTWKIDVNQVKASTKPMVITLKDGDYACDCTPPIKIKADGMDHAVTGHPRMDTDAIKVVDDHTIVETAKKDGKVVGTRTTTVAADGKTATFESVSNREGSDATVKGTMTRVAAAPAGSHAAAGAWRTTSYQSATDSTLLTTYKVDGNTVTMKDMRGESYTATLDGKPAPYKGDPGTDMVTVTMDGKTMVETFMFGGKVTSIAKTTISPDGKTMTTHVLNKPSDREMTLVALKQ